MKLVFVVLILFCGFLLAIMIPNYVGGGPGKLNRIVNNLRQLDAAKMQWAYEHVTTNWDQVAKLTNKISDQDLYPYLHLAGDSNSCFVPIAGEKYVVSALNQSPEARLVRRIDGEPWPVGSVIRFSGIEKPNCYFEVVFPDGTKEHF